MAYLLLILLFVPVLGGVLCLLVQNPKAAKTIALTCAFICAAATLALLVGFDYSNPNPQFSISLGEITSIGFDARLAIDSISLWLIALTGFLQLLAIAASFHGIQDRQREYYAWMLFLLAAMFGVFMARDALLFYVFFELTLVPMFFLIGIWGGPERRYAAGKFFLFTFSASVFTLIAIIYLGVQTQSFGIDQIIDRARRLPPDVLQWVVLGFLVGFAAKVPIFPLHTWLPLAHTEAPTAGSVILAGVLLKLGTYGILRFVLPMGFMHEQLTGFAQVVGILCIVGIIYGSLAAWVQQDIKKLVAYSSVAHLGFCVLGLAALNYEGVQGSILYMINHGLSTGAMFLVVGMIYERFHTRDINQLSGLARTMPILAFFWILFTLSSIALPGLNGFPSEFLTILGAFKSQHLGITYGFFAAIGIILGAVYMLHMAARVIWGPLKTPPVESHHENTHEHPLPKDLSAREISILIPLALAVVIIGVIPARLLNTFQPPVAQLLNPSTPVAVEQKGDGSLFLPQARNLNPQK